MKCQKKKNKKENTSHNKTSQEKLRMTFNIVDEDENCVGVYSFLSYNQNLYKETIPEVIQESNVDS